MLNRISILTLVVLGTVVLAMPPTAHAQTTWYVDDDAPNDPGPGDPNDSDLLEDGSPEHPFDAIQEGIDAASDGDTVLVADGTYTGDGNRYINFCGRLITVRSQNGPENCIVDCQHSGHAFRFESGETANAVIRGFTVCNGSHPEGGALFCRLWTSPTIIDCILADNVSSGFQGGGGAIYCYQSNPTIINCTIVGNQALYYEGYGGGLYARGSHVTLVNCTIASNEAGYGGGVMCRHYSHASMFNCTLAYNVAHDGASVFCFENSGVYCSNSILWGYTDIEFNDGFFGASYSDIEGGWEGEGNIAGDPLFVDPDGPDDDPNTWEDNDFRLGPGSPCIDAADNAAVPLDTLDLDEDGDTEERIPFDLDGYPRVVDGNDDDLAVVDMGAYEFQGPLAPVRYVDDDASSGGNGLSWGTAYRQLQDALFDAANNPNVTDILVAGGTYAPTEQTDPNDPRTATFQLINAVALYGGYRGTDPNNPGDPDDRDVELFESILSGDLDGDDVPGDPNFAGNDENSYHVVITSATDLTAALDGFIITAGNANWYDDCMFGGGIYCIDGSPTVNKCTFTANCAAVGGGFSNNGGHPRITHCAFAGNKSHLAAGGMLCDTGNPTLIGCTFSDNTTDGFPGGAGMCCLGSSATLNGCTFINNSAHRWGGGLFCHGESLLINCTFVQNHAEDGGGMRCGGDTLLINCAIVGNHAEDGGGIICDSDTLLVNCTIGENTADYGGGVCCSGSSSPTLTNCILWGDTPQEIYVDSGSPVVTYCDVQGGTDEPWFGVGCIDADPLFADPNSGHYVLLAGSLCIDAGDNTAVPADVADLDGDGDTEERTPLDLEGIRRFVNDPNIDDTGVADPPDYPDIVDMGAYEFGVFGDLDGDCDVDLADLAQLLGSYGETAGMTYYDGDLDGDGGVDLADLAELLGVYGTTCE